MEERLVVWWWWVIHHSERIDSAKSWSLYWPRSTTLGLSTAAFQTKTITQEISERDNHHPTGHWIIIFGPGGANQTTKGRLLAVKSVICDREYLNVLLQDQRSVKKSDGRINRRKKSRSVLTSRRGAGSHRGDASDFPRRAIPESASSSRTCSRRAQPSPTVFSYFRTPATISTTNQHITVHPKDLKDIIAKYTVSLGITVRLGMHAKA